MTRYGTPLSFDDAVNRDHVVVHDGRGRLRLAGESLPGRAAGGQMRRQHLDRDRAIERRVEALSTTPMPPAPTTPEISYPPTARASRIVGRTECIEHALDQQRLPRGLRRSA